jgi:hypothetical protein
MQWGIATAAIVLLSIGLGDPNDCEAAAFQVTSICAVSTALPCDNPDLTVFLVGEIVSGDTDRLKAVLEQAGPEVTSVSLRSPGGSVDEGIKIGRLVRSLYMSTRAPFVEGKYVACERESTVLGAPVPCTCASACFLVFVGGVQRWGTDILVHRIKFDSSVFGSLEFPEAAKTYQAAMEVVRNYLAEMGVQERFYERMFNTSSSQVSELNADEIRELTGAAAGDPSFAEWLDAKCPRRGGFGHPPAVSDQRCFEEVIMKARYEAFHTVFGTPQLTPPAVCARYARTILCDPRQP